MAEASAGPYANHLHLSKTDNHASTSWLNFVCARSSSWRPTNSVKALRVIGCRCVGLLNSFKLQGCVHCSTKLLLFIHNLSQSKPKPTLSCTNSSCMTVPNSYDNLPCYPPDIHHCSYVGYWRGENQTCTQSEQKMALNTANSIRIHI